jgi:nitric oxide reductase NorD protein
MWLRDELRRPLQAGPFAGTEGMADRALSLSERWSGDLGATPLLKDWWTGDWPTQEFIASDGPGSDPAAGPLDDPQPVRSARLARRPTVRQPDAEDDDAKSAAWMIQTAQPHEHAEDPMGQQRPADRDADNAAEAHAESVGEMEQARLVRSARRSHEVLLSDDLPLRATQPAMGPRPPGLSGGLGYPEWDYRIQAYRDPGTTVWESLAQQGCAAWVERTLQAQRGMLGVIRRRFEMLRAQRLVLHRQEEGDDLDIEACIEARADLRAGASMSQQLYRSSRMARRDTAVLVLVDVSGSTDAWVAGQRRIVDVEREALLSLSMALDGSGDAYAILAFSGHGPGQVWLRSVKRFDERHDDGVARRIAGLEPEHYTRAGAALRHASRLLQQQPARHRLLLLLSDGKPNDEDDYEGRYGVEDMRQAVLEARHAGQSPFCLTVDRQAATYLPRIFGAHHYALLPRPELLPAVLLDWMKRLLSQ